MNTPETFYIKTSPAFRDPKNYPPFKDPSMVLSKSETLGGP